MGNLCSSGTDRSEKKEDKQLPKAKDGEDEALLSKVGEVGEAIEVKEGDDSTKAGGLAGMVGGAVGDVAESAQEQGEKAVAQGKDLAEQGLEKGKEAAVAGKDAVVAGVTSAATEVKESLEQKASDVADDVKARVESGQQSLGGFVGGFGAQASAAASDVSGQANEAVQSGKEQTQAVAAGFESKVEAAKEETISAVETSKTEAASFASGFGGVAAAAKTSAEESVAESSSSPGFMDNIKQTVQEKAEEAKEVVQEKGQEVKETCEDYLSQAVETAKASAMGAFSSASESGAKQLDAAKESTSEAVKGVEESASGAQQGFESGLAESQVEVEQIQSSVSASLHSAAGNVSSSIPGEKEVTGVTTGTSSALDALASDMAGAEESLSENVEAIRSVNDLPPPPPTPPLHDREPQKDEESSNSGSGMFGNLGGVASGAVATGVGYAGAKIVDKVRDLVGEQDKKEVTEPLAEASQQSSEETAPPSSGQSSGLMGGFGSTAVGAVQTGVGVVGQKIVEKAEDFFGGKAEKEPEQPVTEGLESSGAALTQWAADKGQDIFGVDTKVEAAEEPVIQSEGQPDVAAMPPEPSTEEEEDFLEKAKYLLEQHRNSLDGTRMAAQAVSLVKERLNEDESNAEEAVSNALADLSNNNNVDESPIPDEVTDKAREETARDFVEGIIDKATSIVSESMASEEGQNGEDSPSSPDPSVDHAEETMEPKKRGVCFASPQISSDQSFSSLSSPPEVSPPPPPPAAAHDTDLSPPSEASSISQGELVERDIELELPSSPPQSTTEESGASPDDDDEVSTPDEPQEQDVVLDNRRAQGMEEADESLQRIAMEVTTKAVQDAIKIVTENGTGANTTTTTTTTNVNDIGVSSPSSGGDQEEEMTTTDSSQVERGSSVSDLTDTSQQGSIADSLSSYDPGAVFRQDLADLSDTTSTPAAATTSAVSSTTSPPTTTTTTGESKTGDSSSSSYLENETPGGSLDETPTPTNPSSFPSSDDNSQQQQQQSSTEPTADDSGSSSSVAPPPTSDPAPLSQSEVPSTFPTPLNEAMTKQPTIVINSPDSAPNTNGSVEDVTATSSSEALI